MRKLTSLKKIEFVGIAVPSDETKEIVAMMCQIYSRACSVLIWLGTGQPATALRERKCQTKRHTCGVPSCISRVVG